MLSVGEFVLFGDGGIEKYKNLCKTDILNTIKNIAGVIHIENYLVYVYFNRNRKRL
jgi:hypothetical protein